MRSISGTHEALIFIFAGVFYVAVRMVIIYGIIDTAIRDSFFLTMFPIVMPLGEKANVKLLAVRDRRLVVKAVNLYNIGGHLA